MSAHIDGTHDDSERTPLLNNEEDMDTREHSKSIPNYGGLMISPAAGPEQEKTNMTIDQNQQNDDGENGTNPNRGKNQMLFVVLISIMLVLVSVTFSQSLSPFILINFNTSPTSQDVLIVYMLVGLLIIVAMFLRKQVITEKLTGVMIRGTLNNIKYILRDYLSIVGMSFFFPFACILDLSHIIAAISCDETWRLCGNKFYTEYLVYLFYHLIHILFMGAELAFCCKFHGTRFKENGLVRCGLMIIIAANLGLWFLALVYEAAERDGHLEDQRKKWSNESDETPSHKMTENWQACVHETSTVHKVMHSMNRYLYPFAIEFSLLVGAFLATKFVSSTEWKGEEFPTTGGFVDVTQQPETPESDLVVAQQPQATEGNVVGAELLSTSVYQVPDQSTSVYASGHPITKLGQLLSVFIIAIGLLASFLFVSFVFIDSFADARNKTEINSLNWEFIYETYSMINYMLIDVLLVAGYVCGYGFEIQEKKLRGFDWLVLLSAFCPFMLKLTVVTAIATSYTGVSATGFQAIRICTQLANFVQMFLQGPFIFLSDRWRLTELQRSQPRYLCREKILKAIILCLAVANLALWIYDSIILTNLPPVQDKLMSTIFKLDNLNFMGHIYLPLLIFYRLNSFLLFTRAYLGD